MSGDKFEYLPHFTCSISISISIRIRIRISIPSSGVAVVEVN